MKNSDNYQISLQRKEEFQHQNTPHKGYCGLRNQGATCYLNAVLQTLFMTEKFRTAVKELKIKREKSVSFALHVLFSDLESKTGSVETNRVTNALHIGNVCEQQDAAEYYQAILSEMDENPAKIFQGKKKHSTTCIHGNHEPREEEISFFSLAIAMDSDQYKIDVEESLNAQFEVMLMDGEDQLFCEECNTMADMEMKCTISELPEVLTLHLQRFYLDYNYMTFKKNNCRVQIPLRLSLQEEGGVHHKYDLYAIVNHTGSLSGGHYYADIKSFDDHQWYRFNDSTVNKIDAKDRHESVQMPCGIISVVMQFVADHCSFNRHIDSDTACLLFFRKLMDHQTEEENHPSPAEIRGFNRNSRHGQGRSTHNERVTNAKELEKSKEKNASRVPCGLINQGMTCYLNAVLQTLFMTDKFRDHVLRDEVTSKSSGENLLKALADLFWRLKYGRTAASTEEVTRALNITNVSEQQDAAEYLQMILHRVPEPSEIFRGIMVTSTVCSYCNQNNEEETDFLSIPLSIDARGLRDVKYALMEYLEIHRMSGDDQLFCVTCDSMRDMKTKNDIKMWPDVLTLQLKRFEMGFTGNKLHYLKNECNVTIPSDIQVNNDSPVYELYAIINHHGSHYEAFIKDKSGHLYRFNDKTVEELYRSGQQWINYSSSSAYLLMYRKTAVRDTGEDQRREVQRLMTASKVTQPVAAGKIQKTQKPRDDPFQRLSNTKKTDSTAKRRRYCGLENQGSFSCLNAVLQTLFMTKRFRQHVQRLDRYGVSSDGQLGEELKKLFSELETQQKTAVSAAGVTKSLGITDVHEQRDAAELLDLIIKKTPGSSELFKGTMKKTRSCRSCRGKLEEIEEEFDSLQIFFEKFQDVEDALQACIDDICGEHQHYGVHCGKMTVMETKREMMTFPEQMIVELKRSETTYSTSGWSSSRKDQKVIIRPHITVFSHKFELYAVVNYSKTLRGVGRYNADIRCEDGIWRRFDDRCVSERSLNGVFSNESSTHRSSEACLLVYRHRDQSAGDTGEDQSPRSCGLHLAEQKKSSSLRKSDSSLPEEGARRSNSNERFRPDF